MDLFQTDARRPANDFVDFAKDPILDRRAWKRLDYDASSTRIDSQGVDHDPRHCLYKETRTIEIHKAKNLAGNIPGDKYLGQVTINGIRILSDADHRANGRAESDGLIASYSFTYTYTRDNSGNVREKLSFNGLGGAQTAFYRNGQPVILPPTTQPK